MPSINISAADSLPVPPRPNQNFFNHENNANPVPNPGPSPGPSGPSSTSNDVRVIVRLRPPSQSEEQVCFFKSLHDDKSLCWRIDPYGVSSLCEEVQFDGVIDYGENISDQNQNNNQNTVSISNPNTNAQLYNDQLQFSKSIEGAINGYPETIFAYGQTGAGKSYTIIGSESSPGILPRCTRDLFQKLMNLGEIQQMQSQNKLNQQIQQQSQNSVYGSGPGPKKIFVSLTACEVKDSNVVDLLPSEKVLEELQQSQQSKTSTSSSYNSNANVPPITHERVSVRGKTLTYKRVSVTSYPQVMELLRHAVASREVGCSSLNAESSRSHMIIRFYIKNIEKGTQGSVTLVDLAGSEKVNEGGSVSSTSDNTMDMNKFNNDNNSNGNSNFNHGINSTLGNSNSSNNLNRRGEATGINVSLTHLNRLLVKMQGPVNRLDESDRRQSTLNMILYDSLKDDCGVTMIFCIHPDRMTYQASKTTVLMALRCKRIQRKKKIRNVGYDETINQQNEKLLSLQQVQRQQKEQQMQLEQQQQKYQQQQANMQMQQAQQQQQQSFQQQQQMYQFNQQQQMGSQQNGPINFHMNQYNQNQMMTPGQIMSQNQMYQFGQPQPVPNNNNINMDANMMGLITPGHLNQQQQYSTMSNSNFTPQHSNLSNLQQQQMYYQQQQNQLNFCSDQLQRHASQSSIPSTCNQNLQNFQNNQNQQNQMNGPIQNMQQQFQQGPTPDFDVQSQVSGVPSQYSQCYSQSYQGHNGRYRQRERDEDRALIESLERKNVCLQEMVSELQQLRQVQVSSNNNIGVGAINDINDRHNQFLKENFGTESTVLDSAQKKVDSTSQNQSEQSQQTTELEREVQQLRKTLLAHGLPLPNSNKSSQSLTTQQLSKTASVTNPESNSNSTQEPMVSNTNESHSGSDETSTEVNDNTSVSASQSGNLNLTNMTNFSDVVSLMSKRPQSEAVHIQGLKAVLNLFSNASLKQGIDEVQQGGQQNQQLIPFPSPHQASSILDTTLHALRSFPKVRRIQRDGALILSNLIQKNLNMPDLRKTIAHKIIKEGLVLDNLNSEESANLTNQQLSNSGVGTNGNSSKDCLVKDLHVAICRLVAVLVQRNPDLQNMIGQVAVEKILKILDVRKSMVLEQVLRQQQFKVLNGQSLEDNHNHPASNSDSSDVSSLLPDDLTIHACWSLMNLCNKCASNQNLVRNFDGIDILLTLLDAQVKGTPKSDSKGNITNSNTENQNQNQINLTLAPYNNNNINPDESFNTVVSDSASGPGTHQTETLRQSLSPSKLNVCAYMSGCIASLVELSPPNQCALVQLYGIENLISVLSIQGVMKGAPAIVSNICIALAHASNNDIQSGAVERIQNFGFRILVEALCMYVDHTPVAGNICRCIAALTPLNGESSDKQSSDKQKFNLAKKAQIQFLEMQIIAIEEKQQQASNMSKSDDAGCPNDTTENGTATQQDSSTSQTQTKLSFRLKSSESVTTAVTSTNGSQSHSNIHSLPQLLVHLLRIHGMKDCSFSTTVCWALGNLVGFRSSAMRLAVAELEMIVQLLEKYGEEAIENCKKLNLSESEKGSVNNSSTVTVVSHNNTNNLILPLRFCEYCCRLISELTRTSVQNQAYEDLNGDSEVASENRLILKNRTSLVQTLTKLRGYFMQNVNNNGGQNGNNNASSQSHILMGRIKELYHNLLQ